MSSDQQADNTTATESAMAEMHAAIQSAALPDKVLLRLLEKIKVPVQAGDVQRACNEVQQDGGDIAPIERIRKILQELQIKNVQPALLRWSRFDHRRLPAMIFHHGLWKLVERTDKETLLLTDVNGEQVEHNQDTLEDGFILWLKNAANRGEAKPFSLRGNIAAGMVYKALFEERNWLRDIIVATVVINLLAVATSIFAMQVYDRVVPTLAYATLWTLVAGMMIVIGLDWFLKTIRARILDSVSCAVDKKVSQQVYDHVLRLQLDAQPRSLGTLAAQVGGLDAVRQFFSSSIIFALVDMPFAIFFIIFIAIIGGVVGWVYAILLPVAAILGWVTQLRLRRLLKQQMQRINERQGLLVDTIRGAESIRANNASWRFSDEWKNITGTISAYNIQQKAISNLGTVTTGTLASAAYVCAIIVGVIQIEAGNLTMGGLIACSILGGRVIGPVSQSVQYLTQWQNVAQALQMVNQVLEINTERRPDQNLLMPDNAPQSMELKQVRFFYPDSPVQQLNVPDLKFSAGDRVVLVGSIGSGKSTLLKILAGLYRPTEGRVLFGDADLWETDPNIVSTHLAYLPQSVQLFKGTLRSNLALSGSISDSNLLKVSRDLGIDDIAADNSLGMDLEISEGGEGLSGGQRQLVALGRVFLADTKIWLLDEPTSSLDNESETRVLDALQRYLKPDDILIISTHRPMAATKLANRMILMQHGEVKADGKPEQVMSQVLSKRKTQAAAGQKKTAFSSMNPNSNGPKNVI